MTPDLHTVSAAVGTPTLILFGPTPHATLGWFPSNVRVLRAGLECEPCWLSGRFQACKGQISCLEWLSVASVRNEALALLECQSQQTLKTEAQDPAVCRHGVPARRPWSGAIGAKIRRFWDVLCPEAEGAVGFIEAQGLNPETVRPEGRKLTWINFTHIAPRMGCRGYLAEFQTLVGANNLHRDKGQPLIHSIPTLHVCVIVTLGLAPLRGASPRDCWFPELKPQPEYRGFGFGAKNHRKHPLT